MISYAFAAVGSVGIGNQTVLTTLNQLNQYQQTNQQSCYGSESTQIEVASFVSLKIKLIN